MYQQQQEQGAGATSPAVMHRLVIEVLADGRTIVHGPIADEVLCHRILIGGAVALAQHHDALRAAQQIAVPTPEQRRLLVG